MDSGGTCYDYAGDDMWAREEEGQQHMVHAASDPVHHSTCEKFQVALHHGFHGRVCDSQQWHGMMVVSFIVIIIVIAQHSTALRLVLQLSSLSLSLLLKKKEMASGRLIRCILYATHPTCHLLSWLMKMMKKHQSRITHKRHAMQLVSNVQVFRIRIGRLV